MAAAASFVSLFRPLLLLLLPVALHIITPALGAVPRFGALDHAAFLPLDADAAAAVAGFAPRWYMDGVPALPAQPLSPNPRYGLRGGELGARDVNVCPAGQHSCVEAGAPGMCCYNDRYCYRNSTWQTNCCALGVKCLDSLCKADSLYCNVSSSTTIPAATTTAATGTGRVTVTSLVSVSTYAACCNRACPESAFLCEQTFGGQCCSYGFKCALGGNCVNDPVPSTTTSVSTVVPEIPLGCTATTQIACAATEGGGCCDTGSICTFQSIGTATAALVCAPDPALGDGGGSGGLSSGARAGIGVGVAVGAALVIAAVAWFCIRRRRRSGTTGASASAHEMRRNTGIIGGTGRMVGRVVGGRSDGSQQGTSLFVGPQTPHTLRSGFTDGTQPTIPPLHDHGRAYSYHLPDARAGPFTDREGDGRVAPNPSLATTPPSGPLPSDSSGRFTTPGSVPYGPDHILRPVEIGGVEAQKEVVKAKENGPVVSTVETPAQDEEPVIGPFELPGSEPPEFEGANHPADKGPK
ncbi:hypothetical protein ANO14919_023110 [Xylariales sp. No.14919]|nr:hypothetical protein ANO14919_023110 [Xylariales sp. No.14919]